MAEYIELTEELKLSMCAGARAILNTKKYHGTIYMNDVFSDSPKEMPYLQAAEILYTASEKEPADVAPVLHERWEHNSDFPDRFICYGCGAMFDMWKHEQRLFNYCPNCGAKMDGGE